MNPENEITKTDAANVEKALTELINEPIQPGSLIKAEFFEKVLGLKRNSITFGMLISRIRYALFHRGLYMSGEGHNGNAFEILDYPDNQWMAKLKMQRSEREAEGAYILLKNTPLDSLNNLQKKRHENTLREISMKLAAVQRFEEIAQFLKRKKYQPLGEPKTDD